jgi:hypothetical protein
MRPPRVRSSLGERNNPVEDAEVYTGYKVSDPTGRSIGRTTRVFTNRRGEPEYIAVRIGFFVHKTVLLPVQSVTADEERHTLMLQ